MKAAQATATISVRVHSRPVRRTDAGSFAELAAGRLLSGAGFVVSGLYFTKVTADWFGGRELATAMAVM